MTDDDGFIGLPPGMDAPKLDTDSSTVRRERPARATDEPIVFFPAAPGVPAPVDTIAPDQVVAPSRRAAPAWRLHVPGADEPVLVEGALYLGRNPAVPTGEVGATLALHDPERSVSKTHAVVEADAEGLWARDLDSTNGVWVIPEGEAPRRVEPGDRVRVPAGARLELGDVVIGVEHG